MTDLPEPLTPAECDLQDFPFMPLHVARLRDSDLAAEEPAEACWYAVLLWAASWHQVPAASLPDNDAVLTKLIGLGRDVRTFRKHKAGALRGFVKCSDGRLYHPIVAEQAVNGWRGKLEQRWRTECGRIKKRNQRDKTDFPLPTFAEFMASLPADYSLPDVPEDGAECPQGQSDLSPGTEGACPQGNEVQETGIGTGTGTTYEDADASSPGKPVESAAARGKGKRKPETTIPDGFPDAEAVADGQQRFRDAGCDLSAAHHAERFRNHAIQNERLCRDWRAAWQNWVLIEAEKAPKRAAPSAPSALPSTWDGPPEVWAAVSRAQHQGEDFARGYLSRCTWREAPVKAIVCRSGTVFDALRREAKRELDRLGVQILHEQSADGRAA